jgi:uncharacterized integral membrane protein (TIGR00698 family)
MSRRQWLPSRGDLPGLAFALVLGGVALALTAVLPASPFVSDILIALLLGALVLNTPLRKVVRLALPSDEREPDRYATGLRYTGKWILRLAIVLMGLKVQTKFFGGKELALIAGVAFAALPATFFITHAMATRLGVRRPMADLVAGGTMICGASAVNAIAPVAGARREEQGVAIGTTFLFSMVALVAFRPLAELLHLDSTFSGLWSGLAVNDLSSAIAVGKQMGGAGGEMAAASKSARILLLGPTLVALSFMRRDGAPKGLRKSIVDALPGFLLGYLALAIVRAVGDRFFGVSPAWARVLAADKFLVDLMMVAVAAGIGLHLELRRLLSAGMRALVLGGVASLLMASLALGMILRVARGAPNDAILIGTLALVATYALYRWSASGEKQLQLLRARFDQGSPLSLAEAMRVLDQLEEQLLGDAAGFESALRRVLRQLHPSIGELIPVRRSPLPHGEGCRWITYWEGKTGWALVAVCREPGSSTPIHAHSHRLLGKSIEGMMEELRFVERDGDRVELASRKVLSHNDLVETDGLATLHVVRVLGDEPAIDLQLRGPEVGQPGRRLRTERPLDLDALVTGTLLQTISEVDDRPGQGGEGARAGRPPAVIA